MNKKLPNISKFGTNKPFSNNKQTYYSFIDKNNVNNSKDDNINKEESLTDLFNNGQYIFNVSVNIETLNGNIDTMIVGKVDDHIITSDNKIIKIEDILDIKVN